MCIRDRFVVVEVFVAYVLNPTVLVCYYACSLPEFENTYFTFFQISKNMTLRFFEMTYQKVVKIFSRSLVFNPSKWVHILRSVITVIQFPDPRVWSILSHCWISSVNDVRFWQQWRGTINIKQPRKIICTFLRFLKIQKTWLFTFFLSCCTSFLEHWSEL